MLDSFENVKVGKFGPMQEGLNEEDREHLMWILENLPPSDHLGSRKAKKLFEMEFAEVENIKRWLSNPTGQNISKAMQLVFDCPEDLLEDYKIITFFKALNHVNSQVEHIENMEREHLHSKPSLEMKEAGIERLNVFGALNTLDQLARDYHTTPMEVEKWSYGFVFAILRKRKIEAEVQKEYEERMNANRKR